MTGVSEAVRGQERGPEAAWPAETLHDPGMQASLGHFPGGQRKVLSP